VAGVQVGTLENHRAVEKQHACQNQIPGTPSMERAMSSFATDVPHVGGADDEC